MKVGKIKCLKIGFVLILFFLSSIYAQGPVYLNNISFESKKSIFSYPSFCLPAGSGHGGNNAPFILAEDYFERVLNWESYYHIDPAPCNGCYSNNGNVDVPVHSPDWVRGVNGNMCSNGWDGVAATGMYPYEIIYQNFGGKLDEFKCYEVRVKAQIIFQNITNKYLDVFLGTQQFFYKNDQQAFSGSPSNCSSDPSCIVCDQDFMDFIIAPTDQLILMKDFKIRPLTELPPSPYTPYSYGWFEFHGKIDMTQLNFNFPINSYIHFGLDVRDQNIANGNCDGPYLTLDWIEFYESCPESYNIYGVTIAGEQDEYVASSHIRSGFIDKGPAIVASNGRTAFKATNYIELLPGFLADYGSVLEIIPGVTCNSLCGHETGGRNLKDDTGISTDNENITVFDFSEQQQLGELRLYPNPTSGVCNVSFPGENIESIEIFNEVSQLVSTVCTLKTSTCEFNVSDLNPGVYYLRIYTKSRGIFNEKLIKN